MENRIEQNRCKAEIEKAGIVMEVEPIVPVCRPVDSISLMEDEIIFIEVLTKHTAYCFARSATEPTQLARWQVVGGRPEILGKTVHLFGINESGKLRVVEIGGRLGIYCFNSNALTWHTSRILSLAIATNEGPDFGRVRTRKDKNRGL
jgi:hypothetical protein